MCDTQAVHHCLPWLVVRWSTREGFSSLNPVLKLPRTHQAHCKGLQSKGHSPAQAAPPEGDSGTGRSVNVTKPLTHLEEIHNPLLLIQV